MDRHLRPLAVCLCGLSLLAAAGCLDYKPAVSASTPPDRKYKYESPPPVIQTFPETTRPLFTAPQDTMPTSTATQPKPTATSSAPAPHATTTAPAPQPTATRPAGTPPSGTVPGTPPSGTTPKPTGTEKK